jgi:8-oxo-dGTP pyrophosphatase MutT (NUDIX family)
MYSVVLRQNFLMTGKAEVAALFDIYKQQFTDEQDRIKIFCEYLERTEGGRLYDRKNFDGHITTSAFIIDTARAEMLLLRHKSLGRWLQPGGHTEGDDTLLASALREAVEETGIAPACLINIPVHINTDVPFDIDSHYIPPNPKKDEAGHYHHDLRYIFAYSGVKDNNYNEEEATGMSWVSFASLAADDTFCDVVAKLKLTLK